MKTLKFKNNLADLILRGEKTATWRLFDDKNLQVGDLLNFQVKETGNNFARAEIIDIKEKKLREVVKEDYAGIGEYEKIEDKIKSLKKHYGDNVNLDTVVKIIKFKLI